MEDKDIEKLLSESADEVQVKDFSDRWKKLKKRIDSAQQVDLKETTSETVLATSLNVTSSNNCVRKKIIYSLSVVFLVIALCLAIVLPLTLKKHSEQIYYDLVKLEGVTVSEEEFYDQIQKTDLKIFDTEKFEVYSYALLYTEDNRVVGGSFNVTDEEVFATVVFYNTSVKSSFDIGTDYKICAINDFNIEYKIELDADELYSTTARAVGADISYEFECVSADETIESFFQKLFTNK